MHGKYIVIEGLEGSGKSTSITTVADVLHEYGIADFIFTREPGGTPLAETLRNLVKQDHLEEKLTDETELLLIYAARKQLVENKIKPALAAGKWVIGDRHDLSTQTYQGGGRGLNQQLIHTLKQLVLGDFKPDLTLYLDIDPQIGLSRALKRGELDRFERESLAFFDRVRARYLELAAQDPSIKIIDATKSPDEVANAIKNTLLTWLTQSN